MFTLAHLSDPHLAPLPEPTWTELIGKRVTGYINWQRKRRFIHDPAVLDLLIEELKRQGPDHIVVTGDIANIAQPAEFTHGRDWLEHLGSSRDVSFVPGNHDIYVTEAGRFAMRQWGSYMADDDGTTGFARMHNALEITVSLTESATLYHGRPYLVVGDGRYIEELMKALTSEEVKIIKSLLGSVNQFVDSNDQLNSLVLCKKLKNLYN